MYFWNEEHIVGPHAFIMQFVKIIKIAWYWMHLLGHATVLTVRKNLAVGYLLLTVISFWILLSATAILLMPFGYWFLRNGYSFLRKPYLKYLHFPCCIFAYKEKRTSAVSCLWAFSVLECLGATLAHVTSLHCSTSSWNKERRIVRSSTLHSDTTGTPCPSTPWHWHHAAPNSHACLGWCTRKSWSGHTTSRSPTPTATLSCTPMMSSLALAKSSTIPT